MNNQILVTGGRPNSKKGFLSITRYGLKLKTILSVNCTAPLGIWTIKKQSSDLYHSYIVLTYSTRKTVTYLYEVNKIVQCNDLKLSDSELTLNVTRFGDNSIVQVAHFMVKYISNNGTSSTHNIKGRALRATAVQDGRQAMVSLIGGYLEYYEVINN